MEGMKMGERLKNKVALITGGGTDWAQHSPKHMWRKAQK